MPRPTPHSLSRLAEALAAWINASIDGVLEALMPQPQPVPIRVRDRRR